MEPIFYKGATLEKTLYEYMTKGGVETFQAQADDIVLCTFPKCGTTWIKAIALSIKHFDREEDALKKSMFHHLAVPTIDYTDGSFYNGIQFFNNLPMPRPRIYHCHLPYQALPESIHGSACRAIFNPIQIIYVARNPKDYILSSASFGKRASKAMPETFWATDELANAPIDQVVATTIDNYLSKDKELYGPFTKHAPSYWQASHGTVNPILFLHYEELKRDPYAAVRRIADFLGRSELSDDDIRLVVERTAFDTLRETTMASKVPGTDDISGVASVFFDKGKSGRWKERLSEEQSEMIERHAEAALEGSTLRFQYE